MAVNKIRYIDDIPSKIELTVEKGDLLRLELATFEKLGDIDIKINVKQDGRAEIAFADFSTESGKVTASVDLLEEGASFLWNLASLSKDKCIKEFAPSVFHKAPHTEALVKNYGITRDSSSLFFFGDSSILHGSVKSKTRQEAKVIVFDEKCRGKASPVLNISENDVEASHGAAVGKLSEMHLFYLMSRGLSREEAKRLITLGYLKPIENEFEEETIKQRIDEAIEGGV